MVDVLFVRAVLLALVAFGSVPMVLKRSGYDLGSLGVRAVMWITFLVLLFVPPIVTGFLFIMTPGEGILMGAAIGVAVLYDRLRLSSGWPPWHPG